MLREWNTLDPWDVLVFVLSLPTYRNTNAKRAIDNAVVDSVSDCEVP